MNSDNKYSIGNTKYHCKICNIWVARNKKSITHHETGGRHRYNIEKQLREKRKHTQDAKRQEEFVSRELARISGNRIEPKTEPEDFKMDLRKENDIKQEDIQEEDVEEYLVDVDQVIGQYVLDNIIYFEGNFHEDILIVGRMCQVMPVDNEEEDDPSWMDGQIKACLDDGKYLVYTSSKVVEVHADEIRIPAPFAPSEIPVVDYSQKHVELSSATVDPASKSLEDDAYSVFNPFGGNYKGFDLDNSTNISLDSNTGTLSESNTQVSLEKDESCNNTTSTTIPIFKKRRKR